MVSTQLKAVTTWNVATQTELLHEQAAVQVSGCRECLSLSLISEGSGQNACVRCDQVNDLLSLVAELKEEVEILRIIRECEREIDWWSHALPSPRQAQRMDTPREADDPLPSRHQAEGEDLRDSGEWKPVPARGGRQIPSWPPSPPQMLLCNRYEALKPEEQANDKADEGPRMGLPRTRQSAPCIMTSSTEKQRRVIAIGHSLLRGTEGPICRPDLSHREVCCLPGAQVRDIARTLPGLVQPSDYYPLLVVQVGSDEVRDKSTQEIKSDFRALGRQVNESGA